MKYNIQRVIEGLQRFQKENQDVKLISDENLSLLATYTIRVNSIDSHIKILRDKLHEYDYENINSAAKKLRVERATIYKWIDEGVIDIEYPYRYCGNRKYISLKKLLRNLEYIKKQRL